jgi:hypothetical protein
LQLRKNHQKNHQKLLKKANIIIMEDITEENIIESITVEKMVNITENIMVNMTVNMVNITENTVDITDIDNTKNPIHQNKLVLADFKKNK